MNEPTNRWSPDARPSEDTQEPPTPPEEAPPTFESRRPEGAEGLELNAILGAGTSFQGSLSFSGKVRIDGSLEGTVRGGALLVVGDGAEIQGEVAARRVVILGGRVDANITADESIEIYLPAVVTGDLKSPQIYMDRGIQFQGTCDMTADPPPVESRPIGPSTVPDR